MVSDSVDSRRATPYRLAGLAAAIIRAGVASATSSAATWREGRLGHERRVGTRAYGGHAGLSWWLVGALVAGVMTLPALAATDAEGRARLLARCRECHPMLLKDKAHVHAPAQQDCGLCHKIEAGSDLAQASLRVGVLTPEPRLCTSCHPAQRAVGSGIGARHLAAANCTRCHDPHASDATKLLRQRIPDLCTSCHPAASIQPLHAQQLTPDTDCSRCHDVHGSSPSPRRDQRVHATLARGCEACHAGAPQALVAAGDDALCDACHAARSHPVPHAALGLLRCVDCHDPHASRAPGLASRGGVASCASCHEAQVAGADEKPHGAVALVGCHACHEPHGGSRALLLRADGNALCLACHDRRQRPRPTHDGQVLLAQRFEVPAAAARRIPKLALTPDGMRGHPRPRHPLAGSWTAGAASSFTGELRCFTCHDPHKSARPALLRGPRTTSGDACQTCHPAGVTSTTR